MLAHQVTDGVRNGLARLVASGQVTQEQLVQMQHSTGDIPDLATLPEPIRALYETSFGEAVGHLFLVSVPFAIVAFVCIVFIKEVPLRTTTGARQEQPVEAEAAAMTVEADGSRTDALRELEGEVGVLVRRIRRVIGERARAVHPDAAAGVVPHARLRPRPRPAARLGDRPGLRH